MTPHRRHKKGRAIGSLVLEWEGKPVGRIYRATGLKDDQAGRRQLVRLKAACHTLKQLGRLDLLEAIRDGQVHPLRLLEAQGREQLTRLPTPEQLRPFAPLARVWAEQTANPDSRRNRLAVLRHLGAVGSIGDLPARVAVVLEELAATPAQANRVREQALAFIRDTMGPTHALHLALEAIPRLTTRPVRRKIHLTVAQFHAKLSELGPARDAFWGMCLTGMNPKEAWGAWEVDGPAVAIHGTKAKGRERVVPWLAPIAKPTVSRDVLIWWLNKAGLYPYCARHSYSRWLDEAGLPIWRQRVYMGHAAGHQTEEYQRGDMRSYLVGDGALLRAHLGLPALPAQLQAEA